MISLDNLVKVRETTSPQLIGPCTTRRRTRGSSRAGWPAYEAALKENKGPYEGFIYVGAQHGFNNDTTPRYDKALADLAWKRTLEFFAKEVASPDPFPGRRA